MDFYYLTRRKEDLEEAQATIRAKDETLDERESELERLKAAAAANDAKRQELEEAQKAMEAQHQKLKEEKAEMNQRIKDLELLLEEEKELRRLVVEPDVRLPPYDDSISIDPAVVDAADGTTDLDYPDLYDFLRF